MEDTIIERTMERRDPPTHEEIAIKAYSIWERETESVLYTPKLGEELAVRNWLMAEQELMRECHGDVEA